MPERSAIPNPQRKAIQNGIAAGIADAYTIAGLWSSLGIQITGSGLTIGLEATAAAELSGLAIFGAVGGTLALAAVPAIFVLTGVALLSGNNEQLAHEAGEGISSISDYTSPSGLISMALTGWAMDHFDTTGLQDKYALQKAAGWAGDAVIGVVGGGAIDKMLSIGASLAGSPGAIQNFEDVQQWITQQANSKGAPPTSGSPGMSSPTNRPNGGAGLGDYNPFSSPVLFLPGTGDFDYSYTHSDDLFSGDLSLTYRASPTNGDGSSYNEQNSSQPGIADCQSDCVSDCPSDCSECSDCVHDCADCTHDCSDCLHDCTDCSQDCLSECSS